jgi:deoxyribonuclease V
MPLGVGKALILKIGTEERISMVSGKEDLLALQRELAKRVEIRDRWEPLKAVAGVDVAYAGERAFAATVVLEYPSLREKEERVLEGRTEFPYLPGLLSFREAGPLCQVLEKVKTPFQVLLVDGQGIAHPRGIGLASHLGVLLDLPTIGVAKRLLCGTVRRRGEDPPRIWYRDRTVGYALQTKAGTRPLYISPGHRVSLETTLEIVRNCLGEHKLPEPLRRAHLLAAEARRGG